MMSQIGLIGEYMDGAKFRDIISLVWSEVTQKKSTDLVQKHN